jgi:hypothetical protein
MPRYERGPAFHRSLRVIPFRPRMSIAASAPVIASNPVARTMESSSYTFSVVRMPVSVNSMIGVARRSTRWALSLLNVE